MRFHSNERPPEWEDSLKYRDKTTPQELTSDGPCCNHRRDSNQCTGAETHFPSKEARRWKGMPGIGVTANGPGPFVGKLLSPLHLLSTRIRSASSG
ncbi:hypothetical protein LEMLEM_LOCUS3827 [Lemmus lemmus]